MTDMRKVWGKIRRQKRNAEIIKAIEEGYTTTKGIAKHLGLSYTAIADSVRELEREGLVKRVMHGRREGKKGWFYQIVLEK